MLETLPSSTFHLRMPHRCSIGFRSGDKAWPVHHLYPQLLKQGSGHIEGMFGVVTLDYWPATQSLKGGDHALLQYVTVDVGIHGSLNEL